MLTASFDGAMGASGDMILGALLDAGADRAALEPIEAALELNIHIEQRESHGITATDVRIRDPSGKPAEGGPHRHFGEVIEIVEGMGLPTTVEQRSIDAFRLLGEAEAAVHGTSIDDIHFHEVGADDAIADITGAFALLADRGIERTVVAPLAVGGGEVEMSHGVYPVPPPAVVTIAERSAIHLRGGPEETELLTPTGATILGTVGTGVQALPPISVTATGYGLGTKTFESRPNVLRVLIGDTDGTLQREPITVLETNIDDTTPEVLGQLQTRLADAGALDVSVVPLTMKKSRPGHLVKVITPPADAERVAKRLAQETGTLGVRATGTSHRWVAHRAVATVTIRIDGQSYDVGVKVATDEDGTVIDRSAEFDDAAAVAEQTDRPVREVLALAEAAAANEDPS